MRGAVQKLQFASHLMLQQGLMRREEERRAFDAPASRTAPRPGILCVEDDEDVRDLYVEWLRLDGFESVASSCCADALVALRQTNWVDLVVTDYRLPDGTAASLIRAARNEQLMGAHTCCLVVTGEVRVVDLPGLPILRKPVARGVFLRTVHRLLRTARSAR